MSEERRKRQAEIIRITKPWTHSTGPRTSEGKARVAKNALKHGLRGGIFRKADELLAKTRKVLRELK